MLGHVLAGIITIVGVGVCAWRILDELLKRDAELILRGRLKDGAKWLSSERRAKRIMKTIGRQFAKGRDDSLLHLLRFRGIVQRLGFSWDAKHWPESDFQKQVLSVRTGGKLGWLLCVREELVDAKMESWWNQDAWRSFVNGFNEGNWWYAPEHWERVRPHLWVLRRECSEAAESLAGKLANNCCLHQLIDLYGDRESIPQRMLDILARAYRRPDNTSKHWLDRLSLLKQLNLWEEVASCIDDIHPAAERGLYLDALRDANQLELYTAKKQKQPANS